jgi:hypothetical protein
MPSAAFAVPEAAAEWMPVWDAIRRPKDARDYSASISSLAELHVGCAYCGVALCGVVAT